MKRRNPAVAAALALVASALPAAASAPAQLPQVDALPSAFMDYFFQWKASPKNLKFSELRVLNAGGDLRVMCGAYDLPGQQRRPFLVLGDASPTASAAWEPGAFPETDPLYPQLMNDLRLCQSMGVAVTAAR